MGLTINNGLVSVDHSVPDHLHTTQNGNPTQGKMGDLVVHSVFKRLKNSAKFSKDRSQKIIGDNCPLIYAVKGTDGLRTDVASIKRLLEYTPEIISCICDKLDGQIDGLIPMPSSFPLASWLAKRVQREMGLPIYTDVFRKSTKLEAAARAEGLISTPSEELTKPQRRQLRNAVKGVRKTEGEIFAAKVVKPNLRGYFDPIQWNGLECPKTYRLMLVDDLLASGGTFLAAQALLHENGWRLPNDSITWFSSV